MNITKRIAAVAVLVLVILSLFCSCSSGTGGSVEKGVIAVVSNTVYDDIAAKYYPGSDVRYYGTVDEALAALTYGKADAMICSNASFRYISAENSNVEIYGKPLESLDCRAVVSKDADPEILENLNAFCAGLMESGEGRELLDRYSDTENGDLSLPENTSTGENGNLVVTVPDDFYPYGYINDGGNTGCDVAAIIEFGNAYNYDITIKYGDSSSIIEILSSGKALVGFGGFNYTEDRAEIFDFSEPYLSDTAVTVVFRGSAAGGRSFVQYMKDGFEDTFITEGRWKLFVSGILETLLITLSSILLGTLAGFGLYMIYRTGKFAKGILTAAGWLIYGMPAVVLLMILYYVIFGHTTVSGTVISIVAFTIVFAFDVFGMIDSGVSSVDAGQAEAACTLGYSPMASFLKWVLPQAVSAEMLNYRYEVTALIKSTAIVGYITVQDLTKVSDIVKSRTYEAFFPLIATALIYFVLGDTLSLIIRKITVNMDPGKRKKEKILKGVDRNDKI